MNIDPVKAFAALAHPTRLRCLTLLQQHGELCVCELTHVIGGPQPHMSRHLALLREQQLVTDRRDGLWIFYRLHPELPGWFVAVVRETARGLAGQVPFKGDQVALDAMSNRPPGPRCA